MSARAAAPPSNMDSDRENLTSIDDLGNRPGADDNGQDELHSLLRAGIPILAVVLATAVLYFARDILLPLAMATMLSVIFSPLARRVEQVIGRLAGAALVVLGAIAIVGAIGYFLTTELTSVADDLADYSPNIAAKLTAAIQKSTPAGLERIGESYQGCAGGGPEGWPQNTAKTTNRGGGREDDRRR